jgi:hypothetical protein
MTFHVGQKVVCIDDKRRVAIKRGGWFAFLRPWVRLDHNLNRGDVYIVTRVHLLECSDGVCEVVLVDKARHFEQPEIGFPSMQFAPISEKKTDISIFTEILKRESAPDRINVSRELCGNE